MHLWTDYEGTTVGGYAVERLTRSEGRSAFFQTATPDGKPALLRLTESHFDESELIGRWRKVAAVLHANLQAIRHFGQLTVDGVPLACCLLEPVDASLADVLRERALSVEETAEVAEAVAGALAAIHAAGLMHEHVDATNIFAAGETVKLRSDCIRECAGDFEADTDEARAALRRADVRDLGLLLLRCLRLEWQGSSAAMPLPALFQRIVPGAMNGSLTAADVVRILKPEPVAAPARVAAALPQTQVAATAARMPTPSPAAPAREPAVAVERGAVYAGLPRTAVVTGAAKARDPFDTGLGSLRNAVRVDAGSGRREWMRRLSSMRPRPASWKSWAAGTAAAALTAAVLWNVSARPKAAEVARPVTPVAAASAATPAAPATEDTSLLSTGERAGWRVIAYTYNYEQQAEQKAKQLNRRYVGLHPQVFSPTGHAPYFVALGEPSDAAEAMALRNRARHIGLPRDTYARNF